MAKYVDGYIIPIKKTNVKAYKKLATLGRKIWMEHGALDYYECAGDVLDAVVRTYLDDEREKRPPGPSAQRTSGVGGWERLG